MKRIAIIGAGISTYAHLTNEAEAYISSAEKVFFLTNDPIFKEFLLQKNPSAESLDEHYLTNKANRLANYNKIAEVVTSATDKYDKIAFVTYGHPFVLSTPSTLIAEHCKQYDISLKVIPGISADLCLFSDLQIDPSNAGWQQYEANDFIARKKEFDITGHLLIWQIAGIGLCGVFDEKYTSKSNLQILADKLLEKYPPKKKAIIYEASPYPDIKYRADEIYISELVLQEITPISTLYIPPESN